MKISIDDRGNVALDNAYDTKGIEGIDVKMESILAKLKVFDDKQIVDSFDKLESLYPNMASFNQFLSEWNDVLNEVIL